MKAQITFEVTETETEVTAIGLNGFIEKIYITGTDIEKDFIQLLKKLQKHQLESEIIKAIDINKCQ